MVHQAKDGACTTYTYVRDREVFVRGCGRESGLNTSDFRNLVESFQLLQILEQV